MRRPRNTVPLREHLDLKIAHERQICDIRDAHTRELATMREEAAQRALDLVAKGLTSASTDSGGRVTNWISIAFGVVAAAIAVLALLKK